MIPLREAVSDMIASRALDVGLLGLVLEITYVPELTNLVWRCQ